MVKGSVRKKERNGAIASTIETQAEKMVQKEYAGTESKRETEKLLHKHWKIMKIRSLS